MVLGDKIYAVATGNTYELVNKYHVHATPARKPYPNAEGYIIPIKKGGLCEFLYKIVDVIEINPDEIEKLEGKLKSEVFSRLYGYHINRKKSFGYNTADKENSYRFYILEKAEEIEPFYRKYIQISVMLSADDIIVK